MSEITKKYFYFGTEILLVLVGIICLINRVFKGVCYTDEMWYISEPYVVSQGAIPFVNNWTQSPGFVFPLAIIYKLFVSINKGTDGIVLFSRIIYLLWFFCICFITIIFVNKRTEKKLPLIIIFPLLFLTPFQLYAINYNTIGLLYLMPIAVLLLVNSHREESWKNLIYGIIAGVLMGRSIIGTPNTLAAAFFLLVVLIVWNRWKTLCGYIVGGIISAIIVICFCSVVGEGIGKLIDGLNYMLRDLGYFQIEGVPLYNKIIGLWQFLRPFFCCLCVVGLMKLMVIKLLKKQCFFKFGLLLITLLFFIYGLIKGQKGYPSGLESMISWCWFETLVFSIFSPRSETKETVNIISLFTLMYLCVYLFVGFSNISGFGPRSFWLYISVIGSIWSWYLMCRECVSNLFIAKLFLLFSCVLLGITMIYTSYGYVFDDAPVKELNKRIDSGVLQGVYTTEEKKDYVLKMEKVINGMVKENEKILFLDWSSFGYLMSKGVMCAPSSYDSCIYSYKVNKPDIMYDYYYQVQSVPDAIIYIDYGHDDLLSIEYTGWKFNEFVNNNYKLNNSYEDDTLRVYRYDIIEKEKTIEWINEINKS